MREAHLESSLDPIRLGDVAVNVNDYYDRTSRDAERYIAGDHIDEGSLTIRRWGETSDGSLPPTFNRRFQSGDVLFHSRNLKKLARPTFDGVTGEKLFVLRVSRPDLLLPELLPFLLQTVRFEEYVNRMWAGSTNKFLNKTPLMHYELALPPLEEQGRIADALSAIEATRNAYIRTSETLALASKALVANAVSELVRTSSPMTLSELASVNYGLTVNPERRKSKKHAPYLRVANVMRGRLDLTEVKTVGTIEGDRVFRLLEGDVLIVEGHADATEVGRAAVWTDALPEVLHQNHLIRARCRENLSPQFLSLLINSPHGRGYFRSHAKSSSGLNTINSTVVKDYVLPVPLVDVQRALVEQVAAIARLETVMSLRREYLAQVRNAVMKTLGGVS
jgi:type I restriction enzyme, S subunit